MVVEDVIEGGHEDDARGQGWVGLIQALQEEGDPHLEQGLEVNALLLLARPCDFRLAGRHLVQERREGRREREVGEHVCGLKAIMALLSLLPGFLPRSLAPSLSLFITLGWLESTKGPHSTATSGCRAAIT